MEYTKYRYHHLGIPTNEVKEGERYLPQFKMYISGYESSEYNIEWLRFEEDAPFPLIVKTIPHVAFEVEDLEIALQGKKVIIEPNSPSEGILVAFIEENGAPVEFLEMSKEDKNGLKQVE